MAGGDRQPQRWHYHQHESVSVSTVFVNRAKLAAKVLEVNQVWRSSSYEVEPEMGRRGQ